MKPEFWQYLSEQAQHDFWKSNQKTGKCIEGRELIIALPESLRKKDPDLLLQLFTETFRQKYGVQCTAALHHNKTMTNYHIHLVFADRDTLEKTDVKRATRNMFYDEAGRHVRTKKEILDADGNISRLQGDIIRKPRLKRSATALITRIAERRCLLWRPDLARQEPSSHSVRC